MADFFTTTFVAPVDKAIASTGSQKSQQTEGRSKCPTGFALESYSINFEASGVVAQSTETTQSKPSGSNFSMCEIIM